MRCPRRAPGAESRDVGGETVVHSQDASTVVVLNEMGDVVWNLCDGTREPAAMASLIADVLAADAASQEHISRDVNAFLNRLDEAELIEWSAN